MIVITLQRQKCIGCNYCAEIDPEHFRMSKKDGKSILLRSTDKKGFHSLKDLNDWSYETADRAAKACPVNIISVKKIKK